MKPVLVGIDGSQTAIAAALWDHANGPEPVLWHAEVHQAAGMLSVELGVSALEAWSGCVLTPTGTTSD